MLVIAVVACGRHLERLDKFGPFFLSYKLFLRSKATGDVADDFTLTNTKVSTPTLDVPTPDTPTSGKPENRKSQARTIISQRPAMRAHCQLHSRLQQSPPLTERLSHTARRPRWIGKRVPAYTTPRGVKQQAWPLFYCLFIDTK